MRDPRLNKLADVIVRYSVAIRKDDVVSIDAEAAAMPFIEALAEAIVRAGGHFTWTARSEALTEILLTHGSEEQLRHLSPLAMHRIETVDARIGLWAALNTKYLSRIDPRRSALHDAAGRPIFQRFMERAAKKELRWCGTLYPTQAAAQDAEMSLAQYADFVFRAGLLHMDDPVAAWRQIHERQEHVREFLQTRKQLHFRAPAADGHDGTDLVVDVSAPSTWINCAGKENFPDGEVFCGPQGVDGHVNYTFPAVYQGREVQGVRLRFKGGRVVDASARRNEEYLIQMLDQDEGARNLGEIAIGTNYAITEFTRNTLFDEKIGGTFHAAVGAGYPESGSTNQSALHWDMVCDLRPGLGHAGGTIEADGEVFHRDGRFVNREWPGN
jgi:aminopeptidase